MAMKARPGMKAWPGMRFALTMRGALTAFMTAQAMRAASLLVMRGRTLQAARLSVRAITLLTTTTNRLGTTAWLPGGVLSTGLYPVKRSNAAAGACLLSACS